MFDPQKIWNSKQLPTLPVVAVRLLELSRDPEAELKDIIAVIKTDPAISAKLLQSANSSFFGFSNKVTSVDRAVALLGTTVVNSLALSFSLAEAAMSGGPLTEFYSAYWKQSVVHSAAAEVLAKRFPGGLDTEYFLAGLLMDIGRLALLKTAPRDYLPVLGKAAEPEQTLSGVETLLLGIDHAEIGAKLMEQWTLPSSLVRVCRMHHAALEQLREAADTPGGPLVLAGATAAAFGDFFCTSHKGRALQRLQELTSEFLKLDQAGLDVLIAEVSQRTESAAELFSVNLDSIGDPADLMAEANQQLSQLTLKMHVTTTQANAQVEQVVKEKEALQTEKEELQKQALHDALTGVYNRRFFDESLEREVAKARRAGSLVGLIFLDIDYFKKLNDNYGHQYGDLVLGRVAKALGQVLRSTDVLARYGGEEFVVLAAQPSDKGLQKLGERLRAQIEAEKFEYDGQPVQVTISVGAALMLPDRKDGEASKSLVAAADEAVYDSKQGGRNQVTFRNLIPEPERTLLQAATQQRFSRWLLARKCVDVPTMSKALVQLQQPTSRLGEIAVRRGVLTPEQVDQLLQFQEQTSQRFGQLALQFGWVTEPQLVGLLVLQQEDPLKLAQTLIQLNALAGPQAQALLQEYLAAELSCLQPAAAVR